MLAANLLLFGWLFTLVSHRHRRWSSSRPGRIGDEPPSGGIDSPGRRRG